MITVEHLLNHTSGIRSYTGIPRYLGTRIQADLVAVLANSDSPKADPGMLGKRIAALLIGKSFSEQVAAVVDPRVLTRWTGVYRFDPQTTPVS